MAPFIAYMYCFVVAIFAVAAIVYKLNKGE